MEVVCNLEGYRHYLHYYLIVRFETQKLPSYDFDSASFINYLTKHYRPHIDEKEKTVGLDEEIIGAEKFYQEASNFDCQA